MQNELDQVVKRLKDLEFEYENLRKDLQHSKAELKKRNEEVSDLKNQNRIL
jgi:peptidoglycan hydrolase CwlO-like protein